MKAKVGKRSMNDGEISTAATMWGFEEELTEGSEAAAFEELARESDTGELVVVLCIISKEKRDVIVRGGQNGADRSHIGLESGTAKNAHGEMRTHCGAQ